MMKNSCNQLLNSEKCSKELLYSCNDLQNNIKAVVNAYKMILNTCKTVENICLKSV